MPYVIRFLGVPWLQQSEIRHGEMIGTWVDLLAKKFSLHPYFYRFPQEMMPNSMPYSNITNKSNLNKILWRSFSVWCCVAVPTEELPIDCKNSKFTLCATFSSLQIQFHYYL